MSNYTWSNPHDWLMDKIANSRGLEKERIIETILQSLDFDTIQNAFQKEMIEDGYFDIELVECTCEPDDAEVCSSCKERLKNEDIPI